MVVDFIRSSPRSRNRLSALDELDHKGNNRQDQQDVDEPAHGVGSDEPEKPQHQQNDENCPEHFGCPFQAI
jgi:hypothetical protein